MKKAMFKTTLMMFVAAFAVAMTAPVVAHAQDSSSTPAKTKKAAKHSKKKNKKVAKADARKAKQSKALAGLSASASAPAQAKSGKIESGSAKLADMTAPTSGLKSSSKSKKNLSNDMVFDGSVVHGQYQIADGSTSVVENEKSLTSLIAPRRDFKDRMQAERSQQ